jgi:predicted nucleic-acid-binding Zn-ribbon protein
MADKEVKKIVDEINKKEPAVFVCTKCGHDKFYGHQVCYHDILVDGNENFLDDKGSEQSDKPYGPYQCENCGEEYEDLVQH